MINPLLIFQGIKNYVGSTIGDEIKQMSERRAKICARCEYLKYSPLHKAGEWFLNKLSNHEEIEGTEAFHGFACSLCHCNFRVMITVAEKSCPHIPKKWDEEKLKA